jgi:hypothetical protein
MATRMQQRRGTSTQWTTANPILAAGEIGFETDTGEFRVGDGTNHWADLSPFKNLLDLGGSLDDFIPLTEKNEPNGVAGLDGTGSVPVSQLQNLIDGAPGTLNTLNEISDALLAIDGQVDNAISDAINTEATNRDNAIAGALLTANNYTDAEILTVTDSLATAVTTLSQDITDSIADAIADEVTDRDAAILTAKTDAVADAGSYTDSEIADEVTARNNAISTAKSAAETTAQGYVSDHAADTTSVHGIADTSLLVTDSDLTDGLATKQDKVTGVSDTEIGYLDGVTSAIQTQIDGKAATSHTHSIANVTDLQTSLDAKAPKANPTFTGTVNAADLTLSGNLTVQGTTTTVSATNLEVTDSLIYLSADQYDTDTVDIGIFGAYGDANAGHFHTGIVRDASDAKWKLVSGASEPTGNVIDFATATYDTLKLASVEPTVGVVFTDGTQSKEGVPSRTPIVQKTASYTLSALTERDSMIEVNSSSATTVTIPLNSAVAYPVGTSIDVLQTGSGQVTIGATGGVTINATPGFKLRTQWSSATLFKRATDTWVIFGDLTA